MSQRYSKLFALSENQYSCGAPVVIAAGALLKDNQTGKIIAQLKFRNINNKAIKAATVCISSFDTIGNPIGDVVRYQYLDLSAARNEDFGSRTAIALPDAATRSFSAIVDEIVFVDNTVWVTTADPWEPLSVPPSIGQIYGTEFEKQFRIKYGKDCNTLPLSEKDLWHCACGALNRQEEAKCHACQKSFAVISSFNAEELNADKDNRLAEEKAKAEQDAAEAEKNKKKTLKISIISATVFLAVLIALFVYSKVVVPANNYKEAEAMLYAGNYDEAIAMFTALEDYKDSIQRVIEAEAAKQETENAAAYAEAESLLANKDYEGAIAAFDALGDYKDSTTQILETKYRRAIEWVEQTKLLEAYEAFLELDDYKDSEEYFSDLYFIPTSISSANYSYQFSYDQNAQIYHASRTKYGITYEYSFSDGCVDSVEKTGESEYEALFVWNEDGTVNEYLNGSDNVDKIYDIYGNCISVRKADGEYQNNENVLDNMHNVVEGIHLYNLLGGTTAENYYDEFGNLTNVSRSARNATDNAQFTYSLCYIKDATVDIDMIWKNVRVICGQDVWHYFGLL